MNLIRWEPFGEMMRLHPLMERFWGEGPVSPAHFWSLFGEGVRPHIDMYETPEAVVIKAAVPGARPEDLEVTITDGVLRVKGEARDGKEVEQEHYLYREQRYGSFVRSVALPPALHTGKAEASFGDGVLTVSIPRSAEARPKTVEVKAKGAIKGKEKAAPKAKAKAKGTARSRSCKKTKSE